MQHESEVIPLLVRYGLLEISFQQAFEGLAVTGLVAGHFLDGVVVGIQAGLLGAGGQIELAGGGAELAVSRRRAYGIVPAGRCAYKGGCRRKPLSTLALLETPIAGSVSTI